MAEYPSANISIRFVTAVSGDGDLDPDATAILDAEVNSEDNDGKTSFL
jgi:hypothetical protein